MRKKLISFLSLIAFVFISVQSKAQVTKWNVDTSHSNVKFTVTHYAVSEVEGNFKIFNGTMEHTKADFTDAKVSFTVNVNSINTDNTKRDTHLKGNDFFNAADFPEMKFVSTGMKALGNNKFQLSGNMTIRDITKPVVFDVSYGGTINTGRGKKSGFKAKATIDRFNYNLKWDRAIESGGLVVGKDVDIQINLEMNEVKAQ